MTAQIKSHSHGQTLVLTLSNPGYRNALGPDMYVAGTEALNAAESNPHVRSIVITGEGEHFCAGGNLNRLLANRQQDPSLQKQSLEALHTWMEALRSYPKPVIAAVEGAAAGAGFSLALMCDLIVAADNAVFVMAYSSVGLSPDGGATWNLPRALPRQLATEIMWLGGKTSAARLHELGVVNRVTPSGQSLTAALELAEQLNQRAPNALASIKELIESSADHTMPDQLQLEQQHFVSNLFHANGQIGIQAFLDKAKPRYLP